MDAKEVETRVIDVIRQCPKVVHDKVTPTAHFQNDLGLDSLDVVEVVMAFEDEFGFDITDSEAEVIHTVKDAVNFIASSPHAK